MRSARIERPESLYDSSSSAKTFETIGESIINPIDFEEVADVNLTKELEAHSYSRLPDFVGFSRNSPNSSNRADSMEKIRTSAYRKTMLRCEIYRICEKGD